MAQEKRSFFDRKEDTTTPVSNDDFNATTTLPTTATDDDGEEGQLAIDVYQTEDAICIKSTVAGVRPEDIDISINNDIVTIRGQRTLDEVIDPESYYYQECYWGKFSRSVVLPVEVVSDKVEATLKNGILTLKLPKADTTRTKRIKVRGF